MKLTIHRGANQIGGSCLEIATASTRILLDVGAPLRGIDEAETRPRGKPDDPLISSLFQQPQRVDAVILSHSHPDHAGRVDLVPAGVPIHCTKATSQMMMAASCYACGVEVPRRQQVTLRPRLPQRIGDLTVTGYPVDHSAIGAIAVLVEHDGKRVLYSGDLRLHGRRPEYAKALIAAVAGRVDVLVMEGTHLSRPHTEQVTESDLQKILTEDIQTAPALVLAHFSPVNLERLQSVLTATLAAQRELVLDHYGGFVLRLLSRTKGFPRLKPGSGIRIMAHQGQKNIAKVARHLQGIEIDRESVLANPTRYVMLFRPRMIDEDFGGDLPRQVRCIYSQWDGFLQTQDWRRALAQVRVAGGDFKPRHVSGHIYVNDIQRLVEAIGPRWVVPIHTIQPEGFSRLFPNVLRLADGQVREIEARRWFVPELDHDLAILDEDEAKRLIHDQPRRWNVVSIIDPGTRDRPTFQGAVSLMRLSFHDVETPAHDDSVVMATPKDITEALDFAKKHRGRPLLVHCHAGISRSTALAWTIVFARLAGQPSAAERSFQIVAGLRSCLDPNRHVLNLGIQALVADPVQAKRIFQELGELIATWKAAHDSQFGGDENSD